MAWFFKLLLKVFGWKLVYDVPVPQKCVIIFAPHTSNWDFPWMLITKFALKLKLNYLGKHTLFNGIFGFFFRMTGGIPVRRSRTNNMVEELAKEFDKRDMVRLAVAPEGTRSKTNHWKSGFYHIALIAKVPIVCAFLDFKTRSLGVKTSFMPCGEEEKDLAFMKGVYEVMEGKLPELQSDIRFKEK